MPRLTILTSLLLFAMAASAAINGHCSHGIKDGICVDTSKCKAPKGHYVKYISNNNCPYDGNSIKCCEVTECGPDSDGICKWTADGCSGGKFVSGYCPGGSNYKCCTGQIKPVETIIEEPTVWV
ncbi:hypothetical protein HDV00_011674 [Rhizophlyctis rosea]|nr:hypothetical protein HDV00_011674 [Rhizophlyctis rosea]